MFESTTTLQNTTENTNPITTPKASKANRADTIGKDCSDINLNSNDSVSEILNRASLNWKVEYQDGLGEGWKYTGSKPRASYRWIDDFDTEGQPTGLKKKLLLGMATSRRKVFQNQDIVKAITEFCQTNAISLDRVGIFDQGVRLFAICNFHSQFQIQGVDDMEAKILITHSHKVGSLRFSILTKRLICTNQLVLPVGIKQITMRHDRVFSSDLAISKLEELKQGVNTFQNQAESLASNSIKTSDLSKDQYLRSQMYIVEQLGNPDKSLKEQPTYVQDMLSDPKDMLASAIALETVLKGGCTIKPDEDGRTDTVSVEGLPTAYTEILDLYHNGPGSEMQPAFNTPWGILNAVTNYYNHQSAMKGGLEGHFSSLWQGSKASTCQYALKQAQAVNSLL